MEVKQYSLYLSQDVATELKSLAKSKRRSVSSLVEEMLRENLAKRVQAASNSQTLDQIAKAVR